MEASIQGQADLRSQKIKRAQRTRVALPKSLSLAGTRMILLVRLGAEEVAALVGEMSRREIDRV